MHRALRVGLIALYGCYASPCGAVTVKGNAMTVTSETRKATFRRAVEIWQAGRVDQMGDVVTPDYVGHTASGDRTVEGLRQRVLDFHNLYPDIKFTIDDQLAEGDRVATRLTAVGTSKATGKVVRLIGLNISRFVGNRIAVDWPVWEPVQTK